MRRSLLPVVALGAIHTSLVAFAGKLPDWAAPSVAATTYLPWWPLRAIGLPVFGRVESGGWPAPNLPGCSVLAVFWMLAWSALVLLLQTIWRGARAATRPCTDVNRKL